MEKFKKYEEITEPDNRNLYFLKIDYSSETADPLKLKDIYNSISSIKLNKNVPDAIISQFNIAKNLAVYSWFCYHFHQIAEMKAYSALEYALKEKFNKKNCGFKKLLSIASSSELIKDINFSHIAKQVKNKKSTEYVQILTESIPKLRNNLAHGSTMLHPDSMLTLRICADYINQLFNT